MFNDDYDMSMELLEQDLVVEFGDTPNGRDLLARTAGRADARANKPESDCFHCCK
jgi:hypothetical protein